MNRKPYPEFDPTKNLIVIKNVAYHTDIYEYFVMSSEDSSHIDHITSKIVLSIFNKIADVYGISSQTPKNQKMSKRFLIESFFSTRILNNRSEQFAKSKIKKLYPDQASFIWNKHLSTEFNLKLKKQHKIQSQVIAETEQKIFEEEVESYGHFRVYKSRTPYSKMDDYGLSDYRGLINHTVVNFAYNALTKSGLLRGEIGYKDRSNPKNSKMTRLFINVAAQKDFFAIIDPDLKNVLTDEEIIVLHDLIEKGNGFKNYLNAYKWGQISYIPDLVNSISNQVEKFRTPSIAYKDKKKNKSIRVYAPDDKHLANINNFMIGDLGKVHYRYSQSYNADLEYRGNEQYDPFNHSHGRYYSNIQQKPKSFRQGFCSERNYVSKDFEASLPSMLHLFETGNLPEDRVYDQIAYEVYNEKLKSHNKKSYKGISPNSPEGKATISYLAKVAKKGILTINNASELVNKNHFRDAIRDAGLSIDTLDYLVNSKEHPSIKDRKSAYSYYNSIPILNRLHFVADLRNEKVNALLAEEYGEDIPFDAFETLKAFRFNEKQFIRAYNKVMSDIGMYKNSNLANYYMDIEKDIFTETISELPSDAQGIFVHDELIVNNKYGILTERLMEKNRINVVLKYIDDTVFMIEEIIKTNPDVFNSNIISSKQMDEFYFYFKSPIELSILYKYLHENNFSFDKKSNLINSFLNRFISKNKLSEIINNLKSLIEFFNLKSYIKKLERKIKTNIRMKLSTTHGVIKGIISEYLHLGGEYRPPPEYLKSLGLELELIKNT